MRGTSISNMFTFFVPRKKGWGNQETYLLLTEPFSNALVSPTHKHTTPKMAVALSQCSHWLGRIPWNLF